MAATTASQVSAPALTHPQQQQQGQLIPFSGGFPMGWPSMMPMSHSQQPMEISQLQNIVSVLVSGGAASQLINISTMIGLIKELKSKNNSIKLSDEYLAEWGNLTTQYLHEEMGIATPSAAAANKNKKRKSQALESKRSQGNNDVAASTLLSLSSLPSSSSPLTPPSSIGDNSTSISSLPLAANGMSTLSDKANANLKALVEAKLGYQLVPSGVNNTSAAKSSKPKSTSAASKVSHSYVCQGVEIKREEEDKFELTFDARTDDGLKAVEGVAVFKQEAVLIGIRAYQRVVGDAKVYPVKQGKALIDFKEGDKLLALVIYNRDCKIERSVVQSFTVSEGYRALIPSTVDLKKNGDADICKEKTVATLMRQFTNLSDKLGLPVVATGKNPNVSQKTLFCNQLYNYLSSKLADATVAVVEDDEVQIVDNH